MSLVVFRHSGHKGHDELKITDTDLTVSGEGSFLNKPDFPGLLWLSPIDSETGVSVWEEWRQGVFHDAEAASKFDCLVETDRLFVVETNADFERLYERYPLKADWLPFKQIDWLRMARESEFDGVWLKDRIVSANRRSLIDFMTSAWDVESAAIWRTGCIKSVEKVPV